jgi:hypothetical protein
VHREGEVIRQAIEAGLVKVVAGGDAAGERPAAEGVVVPVAVAGPADPAVVGLVGVQVAEHVGRAPGQLPLGTRHRGITDVER